MTKLLRGIPYPDGWPDDLLREWCKHFGYPEPDWMVVQTVENNYAHVLDFVTKFWISNKPTYGFGSYAGGKGSKEEQAYTAGFEKMKTTVCVVSGAKNEED